MSREKDDIHPDQPNEASENEPSIAAGQSGSGGEDEHEEDQNEQLDSDENEPDEEATVNQTENKTPDVDLPNSTEIMTVEMDADVLETDRDIVEEPQEPQSGKRFQTEIATVLPTSLSLTQDGDEVRHAILALGQTKASTVVPVIDEARLTRKSSDIELDTTQRNHPEFGVVEQSTTKRTLFEMDEDPIYDWTGGVPYGDRHPKFIVHRDDRTGESLAYLKRVLRDHYKAIRGGEPTADTVNFVANKPNIPSINKRIVVMDVRGDEWEFNSTEQGVKITRQDRDIIDDLAELSSTLFTGDLGYFVLNIAPEWFDPLTKRAGQVLPQIRSELENEVDQIGDVLIAEPEDEVDWEKIGRRYFGLSKGDQGDNESLMEDVDGIVEIEAKFEHIFYRPSWEPISLTELQAAQEAEDGESDEHYLYKAAIVDSVAYSLYKSQYEFDKFGNYVNWLLSDADVISTEEKENDESQTDIRLREQDTTLDPIFETVLPLEETTSVTQLAIEVETGRQQMAFNFRKIRATLDRYRNESEHDFVAIVVPPRLLHMGKQQAMQLQQLVSQWNELDPDPEQGAALFVPKFNIDTGRNDNRSILELTQASTLIEQLYPTNNE